MEKEKIFEELKTKFGYELTELSDTGPSANFTAKVSKNGSVFFCKILRENFAEKILECIKIFKNKGINTADLIEYGSLYDGEYFFEIYEFLNGQNLSDYFLYNKGDVDSLNNFGHIIGEYAKLLKEYSSYNTDLFMVLDIKEHLKYQLDFVNNFAENLLINKNNEIYKENLIKEKTMMSLLADMHNYSKYFENDSINLIHGDIKEQNIIFYNNSLYLIDFEFTNVSHDFFNFLYTMVWWMKYDRIDFIKGYFDSLYGNNYPEHFKEKLKYVFSYSYFCTLDKFLKSGIQKFAEFFKNPSFSSNIDLLIDKIID